MQLQKSICNGQCPTSIAVTQVVFGAGKPVQGGFPALQALSLHHCSGCMPLGDVPPALRLLRIAECEELSLQGGFLADLRARPDVCCEILQDWQVRGQPNVSSCRCSPAS